MAKGDCFEANAKLMLELADYIPDVVLVHAEVAGQGPLKGTRFGHAFVQVGGLVLDHSNGREATLPACLYRSVGQVDLLANLHCYTADEVRERMDKHGTWGPWELKTSTGL